MQIRKFYVRNHKCLQDFEINFKTDNPGSSTILIGDNGSGKSTMIETILEILMSLSMPKIAGKIDYDFVLEYQYAQKIVEIRKANNDIAISQDGQFRFIGRYNTLCQKVLGGELRIIPKRIITFGSDTNTKLQRFVKAPESPYKSACLSVIRNYWDNQISGREFHITHFPHRRFIFSQESFVEAYLCALLGAPDEHTANVLGEYCSISGLEKIYIEFNIGDVKKAIQADFFEKEGYEKFMSTVRFLHERIFSLIYNGRFGRAGNKIYMEMRGLETQGIDPITILEFFEKLQIIFNAEIVVFPVFKGIPVKSTELSEGQRQMIKVLGMLSICKSEDTLVLMDEPDAHMNPKWKYELKSIIDNCISDTTGNVQAIIATHDPLVINGVDKDFIRIFELGNIGGECVTRVIEPTQDTIGMGIDGLLQSEYYGMRTSYDVQADRDFKERQNLYIKVLHNEASSEEKNRLVELTQKIGSFHISNNTIDFLYDDFISIYRASPYFLEDYLTPDEIKERRETIQSIIASLFDNKQ